MRTSETLVALAAFSMLIVTVPGKDALSSQKSDLWITTALRAFMEKDAHFDLDRIDVSTHSGTVKLTGTVLIGEEKGLAELLAMEVPGVMGVENNIQVTPSLNKNLEMEKEVTRELYENPLLNVMNLRVKEKFGVVTLYGMVYQMGQKNLAGHLVSMLLGVSDVRNKIEVLHNA